MFLQRFAFIVSFPEAIPKDIRAETVAEGTTILCRTGIPKQILTVQGTSFLGSHCPAIV